MKRYFVIDVDEEHSFVRVLEVTREFTADEDVNKRVAYYRSSDAESLVRGDPGPKFYGRLDALLVTKDKIDNAAPIVPEKVEAV